MLIHCVYSHSAAPLHMDMMTSLTSALVALTEMSEKCTLLECYWQDQNAIALSNTTSSFPRFSEAVSVYNKNIICLEEISNPPFFTEAYISKQGNEHFNRLLEVCWWCLEYATYLQGSHSQTQWEHHCKWQPSLSGRLTPEPLCGQKGTKPHNSHVTAFTI